MQVIYYQIPMLKLIDQIKPITETFKSKFYVVRVVKNEYRRNI